MEQKLGRGLSALLGENEEEQVKNNPHSNMVSIDLIFPNPTQPRKNFDEEKLKELADSISLHGVLQPITVREQDGMYEIIAGERRWRASKLAGLTEIPVHIIKCDSIEKMTLGLIENLQRADLNPIEEAEALENLMGLCDCKQNDLGYIVSKSRSYIANSLRLLALPKRVRDLIRQGKLTAGHGKILSGVSNAEEIAEISVDQGLTVRQLENSLKDLRAGGNISNLYNNYNMPETPPHTKSGTPIDMQTDPESIDIAIRVAEALNVETKLKITRKGGIFTLICKSCEELENLVEKLLSLKDIEFEKEL